MNVYGVWYIKMIVILSNKIDVFISLNIYSLESYKVLFVWL